MDRRYYGLKALVIAAALSAAILGSGFECTRLAAEHNPNYQAAFVAQTAIREAGLKLGRSLGQFFSCALADGGN
ncbi:MAG TPA: hypothetical protein VII49_09130 [Rhizomicrobium sp.]